jgi:hypothetical protein
MTGLFQVIKEALSLSTKLWSDLCQPDGGLGCFDLAEERAHTGNFVIAPMLQQARGFWGDTPLGWRQATPSVNFAPYSVDECRMVVALSVI